MKDYGLLLVDKPIGPTSHKVVSIVRSGTQIRKVGHAGTLDPRASGLLVLCLGPATRLSEFLSTSDKQYQAQIRFGQATETYDAEGEYTIEAGLVPPRQAIETAMEGFRGEIEQVPPPYSAIKVQGRKAYEIAREGKKVDLEPRRVTIHQFEILAYDPPEITVMVECSAGTYIRSLANDLGLALETGAHLTGLRRLRAGPFKISEAVALAVLEGAMADGSWRSYMRPAVEALPDLPIVELLPEQVTRVQNGLRIDRDSETGDLARAIDPDGELIAILESVEDGQLWHPRKVLLS